MRLYPQVLQVCISALTDRLVHYLKLVSRNFFKNSLKEKNVHKVSTSFSKIS